MSEASEANQRQQIVDARLRALGGCPNARKAIDLLADQDSFTEYGLLAGHTTAVDDDGPSDALVGGVCDINGHPTVIAAHDRSVENATHSDRNMRKLAKLITIAVTNRWPLVLFIEGDGSRASDPRPVPPIVNYTRARWDVLEGLTEMSGWAPTVAVAVGPTNDSHAAMTFLCDLVIATPDAEFGSMVNSDETFSSANAAARGDIDVLVKGIEEAVSTTQQFLHYWHDDISDFASSDSASSIAQIVPDNRRRAYDMRKVIAAFADKDSVLEVGSAWGESLVLSLIHI